MHTIWQSLAWKEWHEHKWKLAAVLAILIACVAIVFPNADSHFFEAIQFGIILAIIPLSVVIATSTATSERSRGTLPFLAALPISQRRVATTKLLAGLGACLIPVALLLFALFVWSLGWSSAGTNYEADLKSALHELPEPFYLQNWFLAVGCNVTFWVVSLFLWTLAVGVRRADEISAAAIALAVIAGIWLIMTGIGYNLADGRFDRWIAAEGRPLGALAFGIAPGGFGLVRDVWDLGPSFSLIALALFVVFHSLLAATFIRRFGSNSDRPVRSRPAAAWAGSRGEWLAPPRRSRLSAIAWKQFRESGPVVAAGVAGVAVIVVFAIISGLLFAKDRVDWTEFFAGGFFFGCLYLGGFTTLVVGIGVFLRDLSPGLHTFWRSRPISPHAWFGVKYATGLTIVFIAFQLPILLYSFSASAGKIELFGGPPERVRVQLLAIAAFIYMFSIAVATTCLLRNAVYATVLSLLSMYGGIMVLVGAVFGYGWLTSDERAERWLEGPQSTPLWLAMLIVASIFAATLGWLAIRYDWGRKSSY
jgi:ABC-type transport system involved in multi-copper enzyme maturation permease subunit